MADGIAQQVPDAFSTWAILELMGHVRLAGRVSEEERFGTKMGRIDIPAEDGTFTTQYFGGSSVYRLTPTTEETARAAARSSQPQPISVWDARRILDSGQASASTYAGDVDDEDAIELDDDDDDVEPGFGDY